jgi:hypothetical protein
MNFWSRFVFGFLLAQVLPGVMAAFFTFSMLAGGSLVAYSPDIGVTDYLSVQVEKVGGNPGWMGFFLVGATCLGVVLYWFNWLLLARLEQQAEASDLSGLEHLPWHKRPPLIQILVWPADIACEVAILFLGTPSFDKMIRKERISRIPPEKWSQFSWIEDYYLPFALFLSNLQFAMLPVLGTISIVYLYSGFTFRRVIVLLGTYFVIGLIRLLARQQLISLGRAEKDLLRDSE